MPGMTLKSLQLIHEWEKAIKERLAILIQKKLFKMSITKAFNRNQVLLTRRSVGIKSKLSSSNNSTQLRGGEG